MSPAFYHHRASQRFPPALPPPPYPPLPAQNLETPPPDTYPQSVAARKQRGSIFFEKIPLREYEHHFLLFFVSRNTRPRFVSLFEADKNDIKKNVETKGGATQNNDSDKAPHRKQHHQHIIHIHTIRRSATRLPQQPARPSAPPSPPPALGPAPPAGVRLPYYVITHISISIYTYGQLKKRAPCTRIAMRMRRTSDFRPRLSLEHPPPLSPLSRMPNSRPRLSTSPAATPPPCPFTLPTPARTCVCSGSHQPDPSFFESGGYPNPPGGI